MNRRSPVYITMASQIRKRSPKELGWVERVSDHDAPAVLFFYYFSLIHSTNAAVKAMVVVIPEMFAKFYPKVQNTLTGP